MYLDAGHLSVVVVEIGLEGDDTGLVGLNELRHLSKASLEVVESPLLDPALTDEDERPGHGASPSVTGERSRARAWNWTAPSTSQGHPHPDGHELVASQVGWKSRTGVGSQQS